jgi:hypothetical protein
MTKYISALLFILSMSLYAQTNTDVFLFNIESEYGGLTVFNIQNISANEGYDSQPSFMDNDQILFAGTNKGQTDIALYTISEKTKTWFNQPSLGGEYSPISIPKSSTKVSAVRLDPDGLQRLYAYDREVKTSTELIKGLQVAYYTFHDDKTIVASVLSGDKLDLVISNLRTKKTDTILLNSGRSIQNIPDSNSISYTAVNEEKNQDIYLLQMSDYESFFVCQLPVGVQDYTWLNDSQILIGSGNKLYLYDTFLNEDWKEVADLSQYKIKDISRMAVSPDGKKLALVAESL